MDVMTPQEITKLRESKGWSSTELAYHVGVTNDAVRKWERGDRIPRGPAMKMLLILANRNGHKNGHKR